MIFGVHGGQPKKGYVKPTVGTEHEWKYSMFCHSPESWREMWKEVFTSTSDVAGGVERVGTQVVVEVELREAEQNRGGSDNFGTFMAEGGYRAMAWSVTRL